MYLKHLTVFGKLVGVFMKLRHRHLLRLEIFYVFFLFSSIYAGFAQSTDDFQVEKDSLDYYYKKSWECYYKSDDDSAYNYYAAKGFRLSDSLTKLTYDSLIWARHIFFHRCKDYTYQKIGDYQKVIDHEFTNLELANSRFGEINYHSAFTINIIAMVYSEMGDFSNALKYYNQSLDMFINVLGEKSRLTANLYNNVGYIYRRLGDYDQALEYYDKFQKIKETIQGRSSGNANIARTYYKMRLYEKAIGEFDRVRLESGQNARDARDYLPLLISIGSTYRELGRLNESVETFTEALEIAAEVWSEDDQITAEVYRDAGRTYLAKKDVATALTYFHKAKHSSLSRFGTKHPDLADAHHLIAEAHHQEGKLDDALSACQQAIVALCPDFDDPNIGVKPPLKSILSEHQLLSTLGLKAALFEERHQRLKNITDLQQSLNTRESQIDLIHKMNAGYRIETSKLFWANQTRRIFEQTADIALQLYQTTGDSCYKDKIFSAVEKGRASVLAQSIQESQAKSYAGLPDSLVDLEKELRIYTTFYDTELQKELSKKTGQDSAKISNYRFHYFESKRRYDKLLETIEQDYPEYYTLKYQPHSATLADIQAILDNDTAFLEYLLGDSALFIVAISKNNVVIQKQPRDEAFDTVLNSFNRSLKLISESGNYPQHAHQLYKMLLSPVEKMLKGHSKLVIIPDNQLNEIPFEALLTEETSMDKQLDYQKLPYLVRTHELTYHYSATLWQQLTVKTSDEYQKDFIGFAPVFSKENGYFDKALAIFSELKESFSDIFRSVTVDGEKLAALPQSETEVRSIDAMFRKAGSQSAVYLHEAASEENLKKTAKMPNRIIHIASHGFMNDEKPELSWLALTQSQDENGEDGILYSAETYNLDLKSDLLVLSACQTGAGKVAGGEGILGLTRGFLYSGANNIVASLWKVYDQHTSDLMIAFYQQILSGRTYSAALRAAKLKMLSIPQTSTPRSWAGFILIGR